MSHCGVTAAFCGTLPGHGQINVTVEPLNQEHLLEKLQACTPFFKEG